MTGLRAQNRADRSRRILESAARLFREAGYDPVRIEDIAADAGLSPGTVYNHFATKGEVLLAIVAMEVEEVLAAGSALVANPPDRAEAALNALVGGYFGHSLNYLSKAMWRVAMAQSIAAPEAAFSQVYTQLDARLTGQVCALLHGLQMRGRLSQGVDTRALGEMIFNDINMMFIEFVKDEAQPLDRLLAAMRRHHALLAGLQGADGGAG